MLTDDEFARLDWILAKGRMAPGTLTNYENKFVEALTARLQSLDRDLVVTEPMWEILEKIRDKAV